MAGKIFISYRRDDSKADARSIYQRLSQTFGAERLFMDVDSIQKGRDFRNVLDEHLRKSSVLLAVIGPRWLISSDSTGKRRLDDAADFVRLEIAAALERNIPVIPVLIDDAEMPKSEDLPDAIKALCMRQAATITHESFPRDMAGLERDIRAVLSRWMWIKRGALAATLLIAIVCGAYLYDSHRSTQRENAWLAERNREAENIRQREMEQLEQDRKKDRERAETERRQDAEAAKKMFDKLKAEKDAAEKAVADATKAKKEAVEAAERDAAAKAEKDAADRLKAVRAAEDNAKRDEEERQKRIADEDAAQQAEAAAQVERETQRTLIYEIQRALAEKGYEPGVADGKLGPATRGAIEAFQDDEKHTVDGDPTPDLLKAIKSSSGKLLPGDVASNSKYSSGGCTVFQRSLYPWECGNNSASTETSSTDQDTQDQPGNATDKSFSIVVKAPASIKLQDDALEPFANELERLLKDRGLKASVFDERIFAYPPSAGNRVSFKVELNQNQSNGTVSIAATALEGPSVRYRAGTFESWENALSVSIDANCPAFEDNCTVSVSALEAGAKTMTEKICSQLQYGTCS